MNLNCGGCFATLCHTIAKTGYENYSSTRINLVSYAIDNCSCYAPGWTVPTDRARLHRRLPDYTSRECYGAGRSSLRRQADGLFRGGTCPGTGAGEANAAATRRTH